MKKVLLGSLLVLIFHCPIQAAPSMEKNVEALLESMSIEKKVGQMFILGFNGTRYDKTLRRKLENLHPGSIIVFGRNIKSLNQIKNLNEKAQSAALRMTQIPLFVAVDQEGGKVLRIKTSPSLPSARTLGLTQDPELVRSAGYVTGQLLHILGFNMNLAPVVDISSRNKVDFLGNRAFSNETEIVSEMSVAFARGLTDAGVLPTAKHYPGHGGLSVDSHRKTPFKRISLEQLLTEDLAPYKGMLEQEVPFAVMASHVSYPLIDKSALPAAFSSVLLKDILRDKVHFPGIVMTDDIQMKGAKIDGLSLEKRVVKAVHAGVDMIMIGWNYGVQKRAVQALIQAVKSGETSEARIDASLRRVLKTKLRFFQNREPGKPLKAQLKQIAFSQIYNSIFEKIFRNQNPSPSDAQSVSVHSFSYSFLNSFRKFHGQRPGRFSHLKNHTGWRKGGKETVVYHLSGPLSEKILRAAPSEIKKRTVVVNSSSKTVLKNSGQYQKVIDVFSYHPNLGSMTAQHIKDGLDKAKRLPTSKKNLE